MENPSDRKVELLAPGTIQITTQTTRYLFVFRFYESGLVRRVAAWKSCAWDKNKCHHTGFGEYDKASTFYDLIKVYEAVVAGQEPDPKCLDWIVNSFHSAKLIENSFEKLQKNFVIRNIIFIFVM